MLTSTGSAATAVMTSPDAPAKKVVWDKRLSAIFWVNSVAISNDGRRVVAATYLHDYNQKTGKGLPNVKSKFGTFCLDGAPAEDGASKNPLWSNEYDAWDGVFGVAISGDGTIAAASGFRDLTPATTVGIAPIPEGATNQGLVRAYDATNGTKLLDCSSIGQRVSWVSLSHDGKVLAAVADDVYVFFRDGGAFNPVPVKLGIREVAKEFVTNVALHPDGTWLVACDKIGHVYVARIDARTGVITSQATWTAVAEYPFLSVAIAARTNTVVVGGGNVVFHFGFNTNGTLRDPIRIDTTIGSDPATIPPNKSDGKLQENVRWVATSADGTLVTAVANRMDEKTFTGVLMALTPEATQLRKLWTVPLDSNPNSTSIDGAGQFIAVADGFPTGKPAKFHLFEADGTKLWDFTTYSMNWPIVISASGNAIAAGSDDGTVYYFTPRG
jgi:WD40 repeat protein